MMIEHLLAIWGVVVEELAARPVRTVQFLVEPLALLGLVVARLVMPLLQLRGAVRERALIRILTRPIQLPELANLRLELHLETLLRRFFR